MAIQQPKVTTSYDLQEEVASRVIRLTRDVVDNKDKTITTNFGSVIHPHWINYELDTDGNRTGIYEEKDLDTIDVPSDKLMQLFGIRVTFADGTISYVGEVLSNFVDQIISDTIPDPGNITTQHLDISAILTAQAAQDAAAVAALAAASTPNPTPDPQTPTT